MGLSHDPEAGMSNTRPPSDWKRLFVSCLCFTSGYILPLGIFGHPDMTYYVQCFAISEVRNWLASCPSTAWQFCEENLPLDSDCFILVCSDGVWDATQLGRCPSGGPWKSEEGWKMEIVWCFKWPNCESPKWIQRVAPHLKWIQHPNDGRFTNQYLTSLMRERSEFSQARTNDTEAFPQPLQDASMRHHRSWLWKPPKKHRKKKHVMVDYDQVFKHRLAVSSINCSCIISNWSDWPQVMGWSFAELMNGSILHGSPVLSHDPDECFLIIGRHRVSLSPWVSASKESLISRRLHIIAYPCPTSPHQYTLI